MTPETTTETPMRKAMTAAGYHTNLSLALELKVSDTQVARWSRGETTPDWKRQRLIADLLGVSERKLWPDEEDPL